MRDSIHLTRETHAFKATKISWTFQFLLITKFRFKVNGALRIEKKERRNQGLRLKFIIVT